MHISSHYALSLVDERDNRQVTSLFFCSQSMSVSYTQHFMLAVAFFYMLNTVDSTVRPRFLLHSYIQITIISPFFQVPYISPLDLPTAVIFL